MTYTHQTAPTHYVQAAGKRFAYRRFGPPTNVPLVMVMHFSGTMDHWDPMVTDGFAQGREVILFDNAGISGSSGKVPNSIEQMGTDAIAFIQALGLGQADLLGFSLGGLIAQEVVIQAPALVRKLVLVGTGPRSGEKMATLTPEAQQAFNATYENPDELWAKMFFTRSERSQQKARDFLRRFRLRTEERDPDVADGVASAQLEALVRWGAPRAEPYAYLGSIKQPTLIVNGDNDVIIYTANSLILQQHIPDASLILFPDAGHGSLYQYPREFVGHVSVFLNA